MNDRNGNCETCGKRVSDLDAERVPYVGWMCAPSFDEYDGGFKSDEEDRFDVVEDDYSEESFP